ncbi:MAG: sulfatase [Marinilabiliaceae bacterium]|nr:sulfatase [Marinilabiliaceae bacterium]
MKTTIKHTYLALLALALSTSACAGPAKKHKKEAQKLNILFLNIDDLKPVLGCYGDPNVKTPHIDQLASAGVTFSNAYCQQAVCAPSRISIFTGLRPDRTRVWDLKTDMRDMNPDVVTLPQYFKNNGYETVGLGKLMHGAKDDDPLSWSIPYRHDRELTYADGYTYPANGKYQNPAIHAAMKEAKNRKLNWLETNRYLKSMGLSPAIECMDIPDDAYEDGAVAEAGMQVMDQLGKGDKPFFLALGFHKPHLPFAAPKKYWDLYDRNKIEVHPFQEEAAHSPKHAYHTWGELRNYSDAPQTGPVLDAQQQELIHGYWASVSFVDAQIGKVMAKLDALGLRKNTIVVLWGDHGWHLGDHGIWCKHSNFEQATKVPLIISAPGYAQDQHTPSMAEFVDVFPTLCELSGLATPKILEGTSQVAALKHPATIVKDYAISQFPRGKNIMGYTMRTNRYRLTVWLKGKFHEKAVHVNPQLDGIELYDYQEDPMETKSLAHDPAHAELVETLKSKLFNLLNSQAEYRSKN